MGKHVFFFFWHHESLEEMMLHNTASATAAGKVEADVLLAFQIIPLIPIWDLGWSIWRERPVRVARTGSLAPLGNLDLWWERLPQRLFLFHRHMAPSFLPLPFHWLALAVSDRTALFYESGLWHWKHGGCLHSLQVAAVDTCGLCSLWSAAARWRHRAPLYGADGELMLHSSTDRPQLWTAKWLIGETQVDVGHSR